MSDPKDFYGGALWTFAVEFYRQREVELLLLELQDEHGLNVCLLLALCWQSTRGVRIGQECLRAMLGLTDRISQQYVEPLRSLRRRSRALQHEGLYRTLLQTELMAESYLLKVLERYLRVDASETPDGLSGQALLINYAQMRGDGACRAGVNRLVSALTRFAPRTECP